MKHISEFGKHLLIFLFINLWTFCYGQEVYNESLEIVNFDSILQAKKSIVIVTGANCIGCVEYFDKQDLSHTYIYVLNNLSLTEMNQVKMQDGDNSCVFYFTVGTFKKINNTDKSPCLITLNSMSGEIKIYDYTELNHLTQAFTLKRKKAKILLNIN